MADPSARPERGPKGYAFPTSSDKLLAWRDAEQRLVKARRYWLATANEDGMPHVRPVWGVWVDGNLYFDGHPKTRWARNLARDPRATVHLESAVHVVIVEGVVNDLERTEARLGARIASDWSEKYGKLVPDPAANGIFQLVPRRARGWSENLKDATVWTF
jgi:hypothetical protein